MSPSRRTPHPAKLAIVTICGTLFYLGCLMQWLWACLPYLPSLIDLLNALQRGDTATPIEPTMPSFVAGLPPVVLMIFGGIIVILAVAASLYGLATTPKTVAKTGQAVTRATSHKISAATPRYHTLPAKKRRQLTARVLFGVKLGLIILPVGLSALSVTVPAMVPYSLTLLIAAVLALGSLLALVSQTLLAKAFNIPLETTR